jgi:hypothetical protein
VLLLTLQMPSLGFATLHCGSQQQQSSGPAARSSEEATPSSCASTESALVPEDCKALARGYDSLRFGSEPSGHSSPRAVATVEARELIESMKTEHLALCAGFNACELPLAEYRNKAARLSKARNALVALQAEFDAQDAKSAALLTRGLEAVRSELDAQPSDGERLASPSEMATEPRVASGDYQIIQGLNPDGGRYRGQVHIDAVGDGHALSWAIENAAPLRGVGIEIDGVLAVGWGGETEDFGVVVYRIESGKLEGRWSTIDNPGALGVEELVGPVELAGRYQITAARNPNGTSYGGSVAVTPVGSTYQLVWQVGGAEYRGVGVRLRELLVVGWGVAGGNVVAYDIRRDELRGVWAAPGASGLGTELLRPAPSRPPR